MLLTAKAAVDAMVMAHGIGRATAAHVVRAGLAGPAIGQGSALLYDEEQIDALLDQPQCARSTLDRWQPFVVRIERRQHFAVTDPWRTQAEAVTGPWRLPLPTALWLSRPTAPIITDAKSSTRMRHPLVGVIGDWVVLGADITGFVDDGFRLQPAGAWFESFKETWLPLPARRRWVLWGAPSTRGLIGDSRRAEFPSGRTTDSGSALAAERAAAQAIYRESRTMDFTEEIPVRSSGRL